MNVNNLIAAREQLDSLAGYLLKASIRDKVEGRAVSTFTVDAVVNMAATLTKVVTILDAELGANAPTSPSPSFPQAGPATPTAPAGINTSAEDLNKALAEYTAQMERWSQQVRQDAMKKFQEEYAAAAAKMKAAPQ